MKSITSWNFSLRVLTNNRAVYLEVQIKTLMILFCWKNINNITALLIYLFIFFYKEKQTVHTFLYEKKYHMW